MTIQSKDFQKMLIGAFAFVMVSSMVVPAYAGDQTEPVIKCYHAVDLLQVDPPTVSLTDQFGFENADPSPAQFICEIAIKNGITPPIVPQSGVLYPISGTIDPPSVTLTDQFGVEVVDPTPAEFLLVPGHEFILEEPQAEITDHFKFYPISGTIDPPLVNLVDKFGDERADASQAIFLAVPVDKNEEGIEANQHHKCYPFDGVITPGVDVLEDQFGQRIFQVSPAGFYCTQAEKDLTPPPPPPPVGGEFVPIDSAALLVAGAQTSAVWILSALAVIGSVAFGALYLTTKRN